MKSHIKCDRWSCQHPAKAGLYWVHKTQRKDHGLQASNGQWVQIVGYYCGVHSRSDNRKVPAERLSGVPEHDDLVALSAYEERLAWLAQQREESRREYERYVRENAVQKHHLVITESGSEWRFDVVSDENGLSVGGVRVENEAGVWQASVYSAAGSTGMGMGSASHLRTLATALTDAADMIERNNEGVL